ncbi:hypothetical protein PTTG_27394 [Puccinia triticina 1-1 BBBD Race 1]|uniref:Uncharacterized protein n=1 Tax=Puccinia triticina (isolate 1-1 / race 1 (BBBD)) TaxID=630390 RepID=A0A180GL86_PUCT1|nr:hypothetical protein PTTG_27394 [Puccinia triticina 1-1 BBBD Race 1]
MSHSDSHRPPIQDAPSTPPLKQTPPPASDQTYTEDSKSRDQGSLSNLPETKRIDDRSRPNDLIHDKVHSLSKDWLAGIRADFLEIQELMNTNQQIAQDFSDWVEAGAVDSLVRQEKVLREKLSDIHFLETQAATERDRMDFAISEMKKITDRLIDPSSSQGNT